MKAIQSILNILLVILVLWSLLLNVERTKLNQQYSELIEQFERHVDERGQINQQYKELVDQIKYDNEISNQELRDLRSRFQLYLDRLEDKER